MKFIFTVFKSLKCLEWNNQRVRVSEVLVGKKFNIFRLRKISTGYEYSAPSHGLSAKYQIGSIFLKTHSSKVKFHQNVSGNNLMEIFGQTDKVFNTTIGSVIYYNNIQGNRRGELFWEADQKGHGLATPLSGTIYPGKPNFKIVK